MPWIKLNTTAQSSHVDILREVFPIEVESLRSRVNRPSNAAWTRALEDKWLPKDARAVAWMHVETGNIVLVESVGAEEREGVVTARLWLQAAQRMVDLQPSGLAYYADNLTSRGVATREITLSKVADLVLAIHGLGLPA
jgi:hypothetical protein